MTVEHIFGSIGVACSIALIGAGITAAFTREIRVVWRIIAPLALVPLGVAVVVGTMFILNSAGAL